MSPELDAILNRIARRYDESGGGSNARVQASHEFDQAFAIDMLNARVEKPKPEQEPVFGKMLAHFDGWLDARRGGALKPAGLRLFGKPGLGKTALAFLLARLGAALAGLTPSLIHCVDVRQQLWGNFERRVRDARDYLDAADPKLYPVLLIEEVGGEAENREACRLVRDVIDIRTRADCYTLITCNKDAQGFEQHLGDERTISRSRLLTDLAFTGLPDYRSQA